MRGSKRARTRATVGALALCMATLLAGAPAHAVTQNTLSQQGTMGRIRVRPVFQNKTGATALQQGDPYQPVSNPNRTIGDDVIPLTFNTPGPRYTGNNPFATDGHTHYHAGDTQILVNDVTGFLVGDTVLIGSTACNFPYLGLTCKKFITGVGLVDEQPLGQVNYIVGGDVGPGQTGPGLVQLAYGLQDSARCKTTNIFNASCAQPEGLRIAKLPTLYQGQQARVDIPHADVVYGNSNDVVVSAEFIPPQGSNDATYPHRPLALNRDNPNSFSFTVKAACGTASPPQPLCGAGFVSFYIPKEIMGTATIGRTFNSQVGDTWYSVIVTARDSVTNAIVSDGVYRMKVNPVAITSLVASPDPIFVSESTDITGKLRDNSSSPALARIPVEDVIADVYVRRPDGAVSRYAATSCVDTDPGAADPCGGNPLGSTPDNHGNFTVRVGGLQGLFIGFPNVLTSRLSCSSSGFSALNPSTYTALLTIPGCVAAPVLSATDTLEVGTYDVVASLRGYSPPVTASTTFDVQLI